MDRELSSGAPPELKKEDAEEEEERGINFAAEKEEAEE
jgi:hypothetical protein